MRVCVCGGGGGVGGAPFYSYCTLHSKREFFLFLPWGATFVPLMWWERRLWHRTIEHIHMSLGKDTRCSSDSHQCRERRKRNEVKIKTRKVTEMSASLYLLQCQWRPPCLPSTHSFLAAGLLLYVGMKEWCHQSSYVHSKGTTYHTLYGTTGSFQSGILKRRWTQLSSECDYLWLSLFWGLGEWTLVPSLVASS